MKLIHELAFIEMVTLGNVNYIFDNEELSAELHYKLPLLFTTDQVVSAEWFSFVKLSSSFQLEHIQFREVLHLG